MNQNGGIHKGGFAVLCHRNGGSESPGILSPNTVEVIKRILSSRKYEVQTYRQCVGVLGFAKKYGKKVLEECCRQALGLNKVTYTFIKNSIPAIAEELTDHTEVSRRNEDKNRGLCHEFRLCGYQSPSGQKPVPCRTGTEGRAS